MGPKCLVIAQYTCIYTIYQSTYLNSKSGKIRIPSFSLPQETYPEKKTLTYDFRYFPKRQLGKSILAAMLGPPLQRAAPLKAYLNYKYTFGKLALVKLQVWEVGSLEVAFGSCHYDNLENVC